MKAINNQKIKKYTTIYEYFIFFQKCFQSTSIRHIWKSLKLIINNEYIYPVIKKKLIWASLILSLVCLPVLYHKSEAGVAGPWQWWDSGIAGDRICWLQHQLWLWRRHLASHPAVYLAVIPWGATRLRSYDRRCFVHVLYRSALLLKPYYFRSFSQLILSQPPLFFG